MNPVILRALTAADAATAYQRIGDFAQYPTLTDAVVAVEVDDTDDQTVVSTWTVKFRRGLLRWTERDTFHAEAGTIEFTQISGDFASFSGVWQVTATGNVTEVEFRAKFDLGIPTLAEILNPIATSALRDNVANILRGLLDATVVELEPAEIP